MWDGTERIPLGPKNGFRVEEVHWPARRRLEVWLKCFHDGEVVAARCVWRQDRDDVVGLGQQKAAMLLWNGLAAWLNAGGDAKDVLSALHDLADDRLPQVCYEETAVLVHAGYQGLERFYVFADFFRETLRYIVEDSEEVVLPLSDDEDEWQSPQEPRYTERASSVA